MIDVLVITDGRRDCIVDTMWSARQNLEGTIGRWWIYCDSDDVSYSDWLRGLFPFATVGRHDDGRQGFAGAIRYAWSVLAANSAADHIFHLEDDFTFNRPVPLDDMAKILDRVPYLAQLALRRQAWNADEKRAGGVVELRPREFVDRAVTFDGVIEEWLEHRLFWTTNPSLFRRQLLVDEAWPNVAHSEGIFTLQLLTDPDLRFGYYGPRASPPWVHHIGDARIGTGY